MNLSGGVLIATLVPFKNDMSVDWDELARRTRDLDAIAGINGFVVNVFAGEVPALSPDERQRVVAVHKANCSPEKSVVSGLLGWSPRDVIEAGRAAQEAGADAALICAPYLSAYNAAHSPQYAIKFHTDIAKKLDMPMVLFQLASGDQLSYTHEALLEMARSIDQVVAVKMAQAHDCVRYDRDYYALKNLDKQIACLPSVGSSLFHNLATGADGVLTGMASYAPHECVDLFNYVRGGAMQEARNLHQRLATLNHAVYGFPFADLHTRYKEVAHLVGAISSARVRSPQMPVSPKEKRSLREAVDSAGLQPILQSSAA